MRLPLLIVHIFAGSIALLTGTVAMAARKGGNRTPDTVPLSCCRPRSMTHTSTLS